MLFLKKFFKFMWSKIKYAFDWILYHDYSADWYGRTSFTIKGQKWELHLYDEDPFPSIPHLHSVEDSRYKIDIYTGDVFYKTILNSQLKKKELKKIWECDKIYKDIIRAREHYKQQYPNCKLPNLPVFLEEFDSYKSCVSYNRKEIELNEKDD